MSPVNGALSVKSLLSLTVIHLVLSGAATGQRLVTPEREPDPPNSPATRPEPRRRLNVDPEKLMAQLASRKEDDRQSALRELGVTGPPGLTIREVTVSAANLDTDGDLERVLVVKTLSVSHASILKRESDTWWQVGSFACCLSRSVEPFVELRETVWPGTKDILIHRMSAQGTGVGSGDLQIYRMWRGRLYKVFDIVESSYDFAHTVTTQIHYPDEESNSSPRRIVVHRSVEANSRKRSECLPYQWDASKFAFLQIPASKSLCQGN